VQKLVATDSFIETKYGEADHGFFFEFVRLMISLSAVGIAFELHKKGAAKTYRPSQPMVLEGSKNQ
jgi:hypothetical protein